MTFLTGRKRQIFIRMIALADQICFSAANFVLTIMLARHYSEIEFAGYGIGLSIALTVQGIQRNCYVVQNAVLAPEIVRRRASKVLGEQCVAWIILVAIEALLTLLVFISTDDPFYRAIAVSTIICTLISTQLEFDRILFIKHDAYVKPFIASVAFLVLNGVMFFAVPYYELPYFFTMAVVGGYTLAKMGWLFTTVGMPDLFWGWRLAVRDFKKHFMSSFIGILGYSGHNHVPVFALGHFSTPLQTAVFVAMRGLMQPLQIIVRSFDMIDKNFFQAKIKGAGGMRSVLLRQLAVYGFFSGLVTLGALLFGETIISLAYGEKYAGYSSILVGWCFIFTMLAITFPLETVIVRLNKLKAYNYYRISAGIVGTVLSYPLCTSMGAQGAVWASLAGWVVSILCAFYLVWPVLSGKVQAAVLNKEDIGV